MIYDIFNSIGYGDEEKKKYKEKKDKIKKEKILKGDDITDILIKKLKAKNLLIVTEKNIRGINENPFDVVAGDEKDLEIIGFEIKGDTDNFSRLKSQLDAYLFSFNQVYLVLHKKEKPEWLPSEVGVLRVFKNGDVIKEEGSYYRDLLDVSTDYEWDVLFKENGLGITSRQTKNVLHVLSGVRKKVIFNRFFGKQDGYSTKRMNKFYPFTDREKEILIGFDVPSHYKQLGKDIKQIEKKIETIKKVAMIGLEGIQTKLKTKPSKSGRSSK